jgi:hypothetical protein
MPGYTLVPVDYQPNFDDYTLVPVDYDPFAGDDLVQQARLQQAASAPQTPGYAPPLPPMVPNGGQAASVPQPPGQDPHSQYLALRPMLGDRNAMLAAVYPELRQTLIAQAQPGQTYEPALTSGVSGVTQQAQTQTPPAQPAPQTQPQQPATGAGQPGVNGPATGNSPGAPGVGVGVGNAGVDPGNPIWAQGWSPESAAFDGYAHPTPRQPLTDDQLALIRQNIVESAQKHIGSPAWDFKLAKETYPEGTDKCNLFVYEMLTGAGASPGRPHGWMHPSSPRAGEWADPDYAIPGWRVLGPDESPQPGDVVAQPKDYTNGASGHVMIVGPNNTFIGVGRPEYKGAPEKIEIAPKKDIMVDPPAKGPLLYRRYIGR